MLILPIAIWGRVWYNNSTTEGESKPKGKRKKFKKLFKNPLTNSTKYGIIKIPKKKSKAKRSRKKIKKLSQNPLTNRSIYGIINTSRTGTSPKNRKEMIL